MQSLVAVALLKRGKPNCECTILFGTSKPRLRIPGVHGHETHEDPVVLVVSVVGGSSWYVHFASSLLLHIELVFIVIYAISTKFPSLVFNSWKAENLLFRILFVSGLSGLLKIEGKKYLISFSHREGSWAKKARKESDEGRTAPGGAPKHVGRDIQVRSHLGHRLGPPFIPEAPFHLKTEAIFFSRFIEAAAEAKVLSYSGKGQILLHRCLRWRGNRRHRHPHSSLAWEEASPSTSPSAPSPYTRLTSTPS